MHRSRRRREILQLGHNDYGPRDLVEALKVSSDTYFFTVGETDNGHGNVIQNMANKLGIGQSTKIDLPEQAEGVVPTPQWQERQNRLQEKCEHRHPQDRMRLSSPKSGPWSEGDDMDLAVGQGDLQTDPAADGRRLLDARQRLHEQRQRHRRHAAPRDGDRKPRRRHRAGAELPAQAPRALRLLQPEPRDAKASTTPPPSPKAPPRTSGPGGTRRCTPSTARPAPPNGRR